MFKMFTSSTKNRIQKELQKLGLFSESTAIQYLRYEDYFRKFCNIKLNFSEYIKVFAKEQPTSLKIIKTLLFIHAWLQSQIVLDVSEEVLQLMNHFLKSCGELIEGSKLNKLVEIKRRKSRSVVTNLDMNRPSQEVQFDKQIFLLEDIIKPYILYLQKVTTVFTFYSSIKKNMFRLINISEVWILMNLFKCANAVIAKIPIVCKFIRKSYKPIAESLGQAFSLDFSFFYLRLYKFISHECNKLQHNFDAMVQKIGELDAFIKGVQGAESIVNLVEDIKELNLQMHALYGEPSFIGNRNIVQPLLIDINDQQIQFILYLQKMKNNAEMLEKTPKFYRSYQSKGTHPNDNEQINRIQLGVFKDISNEKNEDSDNLQNVCTFRKGEDSNDIGNRVICHSMSIKNKRDIGRV